LSRSQIDRASIATSAADTPAEPADEVAIPDRSRIDRDGARADFVASLGRSRSQIDRASIATKLPHTL